MILELKTGSTPHESSIFPHAPPLPLSQLRSGGQLVPVPEDGEKGPVHPHLWGERRWEDRGLKEDPAVLRHHVSGQRAGPAGEGPPAAVQPSAGGEQVSSLLSEGLENRNGALMTLATSLLWYNGVLIHLGLCFFS